MTILEPLSSRTTDYKFSLTWHSLALSVGLFSITSLSILCMSQHALTNDIAPKSYHRLVPYEILWPSRELVFEMGDIVMTLSTRSALAHI